MALREFLDVRSDVVPYPGLIIFLSYSVIDSLNTEMLRRIFSMSVGHDLLSFAESNYKSPSFDPGSKGVQQFVTPVSVE